MFYLFLFSLSFSVGFRLVFLSFVSAGAGLLLCSDESVMVENCLCFK